MKRRKLLLARFWFEREMPALTFLVQRIRAEDPVVLELMDDEV
jgi:hypothetical protein